MSSADPVIELDNAIATARLLADEIGAAPPLLQGRYELRATLGRGAHGLVCEALDRHLWRPVALKLMPLQGARAADYAVREAQTLAQFDHPNIVRIFDVGQANEVAGHRVDLVFVVMELLKGTNLRRWMAERPGLAAVREVFLAAGEGLAAAHARGFVHGDFKPENVVIDGRGHVRVVDFGLARWGGGEVPAGESVGTAKTLTQGPRGTPGYIAPEVFASRIDARSDQYSFGVSLWEAALGRMPTMGESERSGVTLPAGLVRLLVRACDVDPTSRFPSMQELLAELRAVDLSLPTIAAPPRPSPPWWARPGMMFLAGAAALGGLAAFVSQGDPSAERPASKEVVAAGAASACSELENIVGEWSFTTSVQWASEQRFVGEHGYYWLDVQPDGGCRAVFRVRKHGDSSAPKYRNIWQDRVVSTATWGTGGAINASLDTWLGKNRPLDGSDSHRDGLHYRYSLRWTGGRLEGDWEMLDSQTGAQVMRGALTGVRGAAQR